MILTKHVTDIFGLWQHKYNFPTSANPNVQVTRSRAISQRQYLAISNIHIIWFTNFELVSYQCEMKALNSNHSEWECWHICLYWVKSVFNSHRYKFHYIHLKTKQINKPSISLVDQFICLFCVSIPKLIC